MLYGSSISVRRTNPALAHERPDAVLTPSPPPPSTNAGNDEIDGIELKSAAGAIKDALDARKFGLGNAPADVLVVEKARTKFEGLQDGDFNKLSSPDPFVTMFGLYSKTGAILKATTVSPLICQRAQKRRAKRAQ